MNINYIYKKEFNPWNFTADGARIQLREYQSDLLFYSPLNSYKAEFALYDNAGKFKVKPSIYTGGPFGSYFKINDYYKFDGNNIQPLEDSGRISFYLGVNKANGISSIALTDEKFPEKGLKEGEYSVRITVQDSPTSTIVLKMKDGSSFQDLKNKFLFSLDPSVYKTEVDIKSKEENKIILNSLVSNKRIEVSDGDQGLNLLDYVGIENIDYGTYPSKDITVFEIGNLKVQHIAKDVDGILKSYLNVIISDGENNQEIDLPWNNNGVDLDNIEIDFDRQVIYIFINGELKKIELLNVVRAPSDKDLILRGLENEQYSFDEIIINKHVHHRENFTPRKTQLTKYSTENPYIDFYFSSAEVRDNMLLSIIDQKNCHALICDDSRYYYYNASSWRQSDGTFNKSNDFATFQNQLKDFSYSGGDFFIRVFFESNGTNLAYIEGLQYVLDDETYEDEEGNTPAVLMGEKEWSCEEKEDGAIEEERVDLIDTVLIITTDQGTTTIPFTLKDYYDYISSEDGSGSGSGSSENDDINKDTYQLLLTLDEIIDYIRSYYPDGIIKVDKDSKNRIYLISETKGENAFIKVSGDAAPLIFGENAELSAVGNDITSGLIDYSEFYESVRHYIGDPLLASEVTDEQLELYLKEAIEYYKRYNDECNQYTCQLEGNWKDGFKIPAIVEKQKDIVDILFKPVFPIKFYGEELIDGDDDITTLTLANYLFGTGSAHVSGGIAQDFYISLMNLQDFKQALGINPKWQILNNRIHIYPARVARYTKVSIIYKAPIDLKTALTIPEIRQYVAGKSLCVMAEIRNAYGGTITTGSIQLHFSATEMYEHGQKLIQQALDYWRSTQPALGFMLR